MTTTSDLIKRRGRPADVLGLTGLLADAFLDGDLADGLIPDRGRRRQVYPDYFAMFAEHALEAGHVDLITDHNGLLLAGALWYEHVDGPPAPIDDYDQRLSAATGAHRPAFARLDAAMEEHHPRAEPHHYLAFLAVDPAHQNRHLGTTLLRERHAVLDRAKTAAYLEATGPRNAQLYERHGYRRGTPFTATGDRRELIPMWRDPGVIV